MTEYRQSPINTRYLISLQTPDTVTGTIQNILNESDSPIFIPAPMGFQLPLLESDNEPKPPVTGNLPHCEFPLIPGNHLIRSDDSSWWFWPVASGGWFEKLSIALVPEEEYPDRILYPLLYGIPLGVSEKTGISPAKIIPETITNTVPGWRALNLVCTEIEFEYRETWYQHLRWRTLWTRRLRRAPTRTNINK